MNQPPSPIVDGLDLGAEWPITGAHRSLGHELLDLVGREHGRSLVRQTDHLLSVDSTLPDGAGFGPMEGIDPNGSTRSLSAMWGRPKPTPP
jgi:hypothetical protein